MATESRIAGEATERNENNHNRSISILGNAVLDVFLRGGELPDIFKSGQLVPNRRYAIEQVTETPGGNGVNVAITCAALANIGVNLITALGRRRTAQRLQNALQTGRLDVNGGNLPGSIKMFNLNRGNDHTGISYILTNGHEPSYLAYPGCSLHISAEAFSDDILSALASSTVLHVCGIGNMPGITLIELREILRKVRHLNKKLIITGDVNLVGAGNAGVYNYFATFCEQIDILMPNEQEAIAYAGNLTPVDANVVLAANRDGIREAAGRINLCVRRATVVKQGGHGATIFIKNGGGGNGEFVDATFVEPAKIVDFVGAGDAWAGGFLLRLTEMLAENSSLEITNDVLRSCVESGGKVASWSIQGLGCTEGILKHQNL